MTTTDSGHAEPEDCEWCGEAPWRFRCAACDPRKIKRLCMDCTRRWHGRGFSREHLLEDRFGNTRSFLEWLAHIMIDPAAAASPPKPVTVDSDPPNAPVIPPTKPDGSVAASAGKDDSAVEETQAGNKGDEDMAIDYDRANAGDTEDQNGPEAPQEIPSQLSEEPQLDLEDVLNRLPSDDRAVLDALADHVHNMIRLEDAVLCHLHTKCEAPTCQSLLAHQSHVLERKVCANPTCQSIASYVAHMEFCQKRSCPFCVRIQQRKLFGKKQALDHLIHEQRRLLHKWRRGGGDQARANFMEDQIRAFEVKKILATEEVESLNRTVVNERLPIFNFPRFSWHITHEPTIKEEPTRSEVVPSTKSESMESPPPQAAPSDSTMEEEKQTEEEKADAGAAQVDKGAAANDGQDSPHTDVSAQDDYVSTLLARKDSGDETAKPQFEESIQLAFSIVDASFCSPSKASRCLLNCQEILLHLQHHVDLRVCKDKMCDTVEHHFSHLSKCQNEGTDAACEYCIRVTEREYSRAVEVMEAEQPETDLKIQRLITGITESLSNDPRDEREQNIMQLEDELQQAEDYKKALTNKIDTARMNLVKARRRMRRHAASPPASHVTGLPLHWVKAARATSPSSSSKRRR